ncbi:hypothetical protein [Candidatus Uabimicrobium amorphum]|uniref:Uncharacterized protein n=1 Tax=Uabimicrobium amorphum TaxID=2596890 RepID=A0A5S9IHZ4_UABAM|nr:hypothetical protein [Candidatus Uabimicrobium amorphum]BBM82004.1 hypothetical protein UABAM_00347 [Candidatus Uabimicrobium amorphum]
MKNIIVISLLSVFLQALPGYFTIEIVDKDTHRGIPLVELRTVNDVVYHSDSNGIVAFYEPGLMNNNVFFHIKSHGYEYPKDGFGYRGIRLDITPGGKKRIAMKRINVAERLYRVTGQGIYRDSVLVGKSLPSSSVINSNVMGQDTVMMAKYRDKLYWFWGDTNRVSYPLGNFKVSGATSIVSDPDHGIDLHYFRENDFCKALCPFAKRGVVWIESVVVLEDDTNRERLIAQYEELKDLTTVLQRGLVMFDDETQVFKPLSVFDLQDLYPRGHPFRAMVNNEEYLFFAHPHPQPFPNVRVKATLKDIQQPDNYEVLVKNERGFIWKKGKKCLEAKSDDWIFLRDMHSEKQLHMHAGSIFWNPYRKRWILIGQEAGGSSSFLGEIWYAEADTPIGPWVYARKIVTHTNYTFYNPTQHPIFDKENGKIIYFEGTYTNTFTKVPVTATPRYNYNQIMYRLHLDDERVYLPCPVYENGSEFSFKEKASQYDTIAFFALPADREKSSAVAIYQDGSRLTTNKMSGEPLFYAAKNNAIHTTALCEYQNRKSAKYHYSVKELPSEEWKKVRTVCRVWKNPTRSTYDYSIKPQE